MRTDIEETRADLVDTVNELSDRLNPANRVAAVKQGASDTTKHAVEQAGDLTKDAAAKAQNVAKAGVESQSAIERRQAKAIGRIGAARGGAHRGLASLETTPVIKLFYKPWGMLAGMLGGALAGMLFKRVWRLLSGEDAAPTATDRSRGWAEVVLAAGLEGAVYGAVKAFVDRGGAAGFERATGTWPGTDSGA